MRSIEFSAVNNAAFTGIEMKFALRQTTATDEDGL
jgi:hypothetical protein